MVISSHGTIWDFGPVSHTPSFPSEVCGNLPSGLRSVSTVLFLTVMMPATPFPALLGSVGTLHNSFHSWNL